MENLFNASVWRRRDRIHREKWKGNYVLVTEKILSNMDKNIYEDFSFSMKENLSLFSEDGFRQDECIVSKKFF